MAIRKNFKTRVKDTFQEVRSQWREYKIFTYIGFFLVFTGMLVWGFSSGAISAVVHRGVVTTVQLADAVETDHYVSRLLSFSKPHTLKGSKHSAHNAGSKKLVTKRVAEAVKPEAPPVAFLAPESVTDLPPEHAQPNVNETVDPPKPVVQTPVKVAKAPAPMIKVAQAAPAAKTVVAANPPKPRLAVKASSPVRSALPAPPVVHKRVARTLVGNNFPLMWGLKKDPRNAGHIVASRIRATALLDPTGHALLQPDECPVHGACVTNAIELAEMNRLHPELHIATFVELADYYDSLVCHPAPDGMYWNDRLDRSGNPATTDHYRAFHRGEYVCVDPHSGQIIVAVDCGNIVGAKVVRKPLVVAVPNDECVEVHYNTNEGEMVSGAVLGDEPLPPSTCFALKVAGDSEFRTPPLGCPDTNCNFNADVAVTGLARQHSWRYRAHSGENILRLPAMVARKLVRYEVVLCKQHLGHQTMGVGIRWVHYLDDHPKRAIVYDSPDLIPRGLSSDYDLAWRWAY